MATEKRLIDAEPIKKFIVDGLNNPDQKKAFGYDAIEILTEIEYAPTVDAVEVVHGRWIEKREIPSYSNKNIPVVECSKCRIIFCDIINNHNFMYHYCPNCGAKMDGDKNG